MQTPSPFNRRVHIYVAGPMFGSGRITANTHHAIAVAERLRAAGLYPFVPHLYSLWDTISPHDDPAYWLEMDRAWLGLCDAMVRIAGQSPGATQEEQWCQELTIPVYWEDPGNGQHGVQECIEHWAWHGRLVTDMANALLGQGLLAPGDAQGRETREGATTTLAPATASPQGGAQASVELRAQATTVRAIYEPEE